LNRQIAKYVCLGCTALSIDLLAFQAFLHTGFPPAGAAAAAYVIAGCVHFTGNRIWTFRAFHRAPIVQLRSYLAVVCTAWCITIAVVGWGTALAHLSPIEAKLLAVALTLPVGFFGHKYVTYASGMRAALQRAGRYAAHLILEKADACTGRH
jgi:putative flippase GtrA